MKTHRFLFIILLLSSTIFAQNTENNYDYLDDEYLDLEAAGGVTIFANRLNASKEAKVLSSLSGSLTDRKSFIENDFLENSGFRRSGNVQYRKTDGGEKALSVLTGISHLLSFGLVKRKPFSEQDYGRLPSGEHYSFDFIINSSEFKDLSPDIILIMRLEYIFQKEFGNGILTRDIEKYYANENIEKFELLVNKLPEYPENIRQIKLRYVSIELPRIKRSLERHNNPSEDYLQALENLKDIFGKH